MQTEEVEPPECRIVQRDLKDPLQKWEKIVGREHERIPVAAKQKHAQQQRMKIMADKIRNIKKLRVKLTQATVGWLVTYRPLTAEKRGSIQCVRSSEVQKEFGNITRASPWRGGVQHFARRRGRCKTSLAMFEVRKNLGKALAVLHGGTEVAKTYLNETRTQRREKTRYQSKEKVFLREGSEEAQDSDGWDVW